LNHGDIEAERYGLLEFKYTIIFNQPCFAVPWYGCGLVAATEAILRLRRQVIELQSQVRQLQAELNAQHANQHMRLACYREDYYEATWIELEIQE
jgi:hypothetical protein